jgi:hypothetical protein
MCLMKVHIMKDFSCVMRKLVMFLSLRLKFLYQILSNNLDVGFGMLDNYFNFYGQERIDPSLETFMECE